MNSLSCGFLMKVITKTPPVALLAFAFAWGCNGADALEEADGPSLGAPERYEFESRSGAGSSVSYSGQILRHVLISDLAAVVGGLHDRIEGGFDTSGDAVFNALNAYYEFDSVSLGAEKLRLQVSGVELLQTRYDDLSSGKDLRGKIAGRDSGAAYHRDFLTEFAGFDDVTLAQYGGSIDSPDGFVLAMLRTLNAQAIDQELNGLTREVSDGSGGTVRLKTHQTESGLDLEELLQKFLLGAVAFSQATDDYLDEGLNEDNSQLEAGEAFTPLEHAWDEAFGYFGAARDYLLIGDQTVADGEVVDSNGDGKLDLLSEFSFGAATNAAKRDHGARSGVDLSGDAMRAFIRGRHIISSSQGDLDAAARRELEEARDSAVAAWEAALAATAIHYVNEVVADYEAMGTADYAFDDHAAHFSELKGFALSLQFAPKSPLDLDGFKQLHALIGDAPLLGDAAGADRRDYVERLLEARTLLTDAYAFEESDIENW